MTPARSLALLLGLGPLLPAQQVTQMDNGARLVTVERSALPLTTIALYFARGTAHEPDAERGIGRFALPMVWLGHAELDERAVQDALDEIGGTVEAEVGAEHALVQISCLSAHAGSALQLLDGALLQPRLEPELVERERARALATIRHSLDQPEFLAQQAAVQAVLGDHPYAAALRLTEPERLRGWTREALQGGIARLLAARDAVCVLVGPPDPELAAGLRVLLGKLPAGTERPQVPAPATHAADPRVFKVPRPQMDQVYIQLAGLGIAAQDASRAAIEVVQRVVASGFTSVLVDELRVDHGLVYGVGLSQGFLSRPSPFALITRTRADQVPEVLRRIGAALTRVADGEFPDSALVAARATLRGDYGAALQTHEGTAWAVFEAISDHGDPTAWRRRLREMADVGRDAVAAAARTHRPKGITVVLVGDPAALAQLQVDALR